MRLIWSGPHRARPKRLGDGHNFGQPPVHLKIVLDHADGYANQKLLFCIGQSKNGPIESSAIRLLPIPDHSDTLDSYRSTMGVPPSHADRVRVVSWLLLPHDCHALVEGLAQFAL